MALNDNPVLINQIIEQMKEIEHLKNNLLNAEEEIAELREALDLIQHEAKTGNKYDLIVKLAREALEEK